tara:strand:+ start:523 stop:1152 length:630 start_codon:yes stop_codon:yes gene_type:complete
MTKEEKTERTTPVEPPESVRFTARAVDRTGKKFHNLLVVELAGRNKWRQLLWRCRCDCGNEVVKVSGDLGRTRSCGCKHSSQDQKTGTNSPFWKGVGEISGYRLGKIKDTAKRRGLAYEIEDEHLWNLFLQQNRRCALSGLPLAFGKKGAECGNASLDRIDSRKGYIKDNIQWIHKDVNVMKMDFDQNYFLDLCEAINYNRNRQGVVDE